MFLIRTNFIFFLRARRQWSTLLRESCWFALLGHLLRQLRAAAAPQPSTSGKATTHPKSFCGNPEAATQYDSLLGVLLAKFHQIFRLLVCGAAAARNCLSRWLKRVSQQDSRSRPLATSAQKKSENWVAWFSGFQKSPFFFSSFFESAAGGF